MLAWAGGAVLAGGLALELAVRAGGLVDFPLYAVDPELGYIPQPNQTGWFLNRNRWAFNDLSMPTARPWQPDVAADVLLIGNSVVMGGDPYDQPDKLGPLVQRALGPTFSVWPVAVGGWTNVNETAYLERHPEVVAAAEFFVWEVMPGGLGTASGWGGDYVWPRQRPLWASWFAFRRYLLPRLMPAAADSELPPRVQMDPAALARFAAVLSRLSAAAGAPKPGLLLLYPTQADLRTARSGGEWLPERAQMLALAARDHLGVIDVAADPAWNAGLYRDGVHPTVAGNAVLARIITRAVQQAAEHARWQGAAAPAREAAQQAFDAAGQALVRPAADTLLRQ
jgi:hypothetical protein